MNKARREALNNLIGQIESIRDQLETLRDEEQEYYDGMHENFQNGEKGEAAQAAITSMEEAISGLETAEQEVANASEG